MTKFDLSFDPPAPITKIALRIIKSGERLRDVKMLLDTGSDISLLPRASINALGIEPSAIKEYELVGFDGNITKSNFPLTSDFYRAAIYRKLLRDRRYSRDNRPGYS